MLGSMLVVLTTISAVADPASAPDVTQPPAYEEFIVIPLRVHVLSATDLVEVDCGLKDDDLTRILGKVNGVWHMAGIHFGLESLVREPAAEQERFRALRNITGDASLGSYPMLTPTDTREFAGLHVYYVHKMPVNGVHYGGDFAFVQETASLRKVEGGIDEPLPRVTSHEFGHALSLPHRQNETNLMASGTTGTLLNETEVKQARDAAKKIHGAQTVAEVRVAAIDAETRKETATAKRLWTWLSQLPGDGAKAARQRITCE